LKLRIFLLLFLATAATSYGQVSFQSVILAFPQVAVGGDPGGPNYTTLIQMVNNNSVNVTGTLTLLSDSGTAMQASFDGASPQSMLQVTIGPSEFREIAVTLDGSLTVGWLAVSFSPSDALTSVILQYRSGATLLSEVGVDPAYSTILGTDFAIDTDTTLNTGVALANPSTAPVYVLARLWDPVTGDFSGGSTIIAIPGNGHIARFVTEIFPDALSIAKTRAKVSLDSCSSPSCAFAGGNGFIATAIRINGNQFTTVPVTQRVTSPETTRVLPQVAFGGDPGGMNFKTVLYLTTNVTTGIFGTAELFDNDGNPMAASVDGGARVTSFPFTVLGNRVTRIVLSGDETLQSGWLRLTLSAQAHLVANAVFQTFQGTSLTSEASVLETPSVQTGLLALRVQPGTDIGVAVANPQLEANTVTFTLHDLAGSNVDTREVVLPPTGHLAQFVTELFPQLTEVSIFDGSLSIRSTAAMAPLALRLSSGKIATLPVVEDGFHRPSITSMGITRTVRSPAEVDFSIDVTDVDADVAATGASSVTVTALIVFAGGFNDAAEVTVDGAAMINQATGKLTGSFRPPRVTGAVPANTQAVLYLQVYDSQGNLSNVVSTTFRF